MISIPNEMLEKYGILPYEECAQQWAEIEDEVEKEKLFCRLFLSETDFITSKILEGVATSADYADELYYREVARREIDGGEITQAVPLDALLSTLLGVE